MKRDQTSCHPKEYGQLTEGAGRCLNSKILGQEANLALLMGHQFLIEFENLSTSLSHTFECCELWVKSDFLKSELTFAHKHPL